MNARNALKKYTLQFSLLMAVYTLVLVVSLNMLKNMEPSSFWKYIVACLPAIPIVLIAISTFRYHRQQDELHQLIQFKAVVSAFMISGIFFTFYGFLQNAGLPPLDAIWAFPLMIITWGLCGAYFSWQYLSNNSGKPNSADHMA